ncbi:unnamed protein product [Effrenium voratum]|nr:unnamed protein product [Effrenium voratum]
MRYKQFSEDCQSLLEHLLHEEPEMRPTAAEALQHPWFQQTKSHPVDGEIESLLERCFRRMHDFCQRSQLQKTIMYSMVAFAPLHNHHMEQLLRSIPEVRVKASVIFRHCFSFCRSRPELPRISCFEFVELGRKHSAFSPAELRRSFAVANVSRSGKLSYCEWLAAAAPADWYSQQSNAQRAFDTLDVKRNGHLCAADLCQLLPKVLDREQIDTEIRTFSPEGLRCCG